MASGNPRGLQIEVTNGSGVTSGTIHYGKSFLNLLTEKLDTYLKFNSIIDTRMNNLNDTLRTVSEKRTALEGRIEKLTERYAKQYSAMESTIAQFQETGNMLTAMLETKKINLKIFSITLSLIFLKIFCWKSSSISFKISFWIINCKS